MLSEDEKFLLISENIDKYIGYSQVRERVYTFYETDAQVHDAYIFFYYSRWIWSGCQSLIFSIMLMLISLDQIFQG